MSKNVSILKRKLESLTGHIVLFEQESGIKVKSAVAVIFKDSKCLMGISKNADDRFGKLCFPGGGIEKGETPYQTAKRETLEESGINVKYQALPWFILGDQPSVAFVLCKYIDGEIKPNHEFENLDWYNYDSQVKDKMYKNNFQALMHFKK